MGHSGVQVKELNFLLNVKFKSIFIYGLLKIYGIFDTVDFTRFSSKKNNLLSTFKLNLLTSLNFLIYQLLQIRQYHYNPEYESYYFYNLIKAQKFLSKQ